MADSVALVGMSGVGKSSVGRTLAAMCSLRFIDTDKEIEKRAGCSVPEIFRRFGEPHFRALEHEIVRRMSRIPFIVLACGGGAVTDPENVKMLKEHSFVIYLSATAETIASHIGRAESRPLLAGDPRERITKLLSEREQLYIDVADEVIDCNGADMRGVANEAAARLLNSDNAKATELKRFVKRMSGLKL